MTGSRSAVRRGTGSPSSGSREARRRPSPPGRPTPRARPIGCAGGGEARRPRGPARTTCHLPAARIGAIVPRLVMVGGEVVFSRRYCWGPATGLATARPIAAVRRSRPMLDGVLRTAGRRPSALACTPGLVVFVGVVAHGLGWLLMPASHRGLGVEATGTSWARRCWCAGRGRLRWLAFGLDATAGSAVTGLGLCWRRPVSDDRPIVGRARTPDGARARRGAGRAAGAGEEERHRGGARSGSTPGPTPCRSGSRRPGCEISDRHRRPRPSRAGSTRTARPPS